MPPLDFAALIPDKQSGLPDLVPDSRPEAPDFASQLPSTGTGNVIRAMLGGYKEGFEGTPGLLTRYAQAELDRIQEQGGIKGGLANLLSLVAEDVHAPLAVGPGVFRAIQAGVAQLGTEAGQPALGRDIAALPEAFLGSPGMLRTPEGAAPSVAAPRVEPGFGPEPSPGGGPTPRLTGPEAPPVAPAPRLLAAPTEAAPESPAQAAAPATTIALPSPPVELTPDPAPQAQATPQPAPQTEAARPEPHGGPWTRVKTRDGQGAANLQGEPLFENKNGVRALMDDGVPWTERVTEHPEKGMVPRDPINRRGQFLTAEETGRAAAPKPIPEKEGVIPESAPAEKPEWTSIGKNSDGLEVFANPQGVHSIVEDGVRDVEPVRLRPTRSGMEMSVPAVGEKDARFRVAGENVPELGQKRTEIEPVEAPAELVTKPPAAAPRVEKVEASEPVAPAELNPDEPLSFDHLVPARGKRETTPFASEPPEPTRLIQFLRQRWSVGDGLNTETKAGGLKDAGGDLASIVGGNKATGPLRSVLNAGPKHDPLINPNGMNLDDAAMRAWEAGYFPEHSERPTINDLLNKIDEDLNRGNPQYSHHDQAEIEDYRDAVARNREIDRLATDHDIPTRGLTHDQFFDALADRLSADQMAAEHAALEEAHAEAYRAFEGAAKDFVKDAASDWNPAEFHGNDQARGLEELEDEYRQEVSAAEAQQRARGGPEPGTAAPSADAGQEGGGRERGIAGPSGRDEPQGGTRATDLLGHAIRAPTRRAPEATIRNDPNQAVMPGMAPSAVQAQAARDATGPRGGQERANEGLFAPKGAEQPELAVSKDDSVHGAGDGSMKKAQIGNTTIDYRISEDGKTGEVVLIKTPPFHRNQGAARKAMNDFLAEADRRGTTMFLNSDPMDKGVSKKRLDAFYKSLGFVKNTGKKKDFSSTGEFVRRPNGVEIGGHYLPLNPNGTVTLFHATNKDAADQIVSEKIVRSGGEPSVYFSTAKNGTGYGAHVVAIQIDPKALKLDDEFPDGRLDFRADKKWLTVPHAALVTTETEPD